MTLAEIYKQAYNGAANNAMLDALGEEKYHETLHQRALCAVAAHGYEQGRHAPLPNPAPVDLPPSIFRDALAQAWTHVLRKNRGAGVSMHRVDPAVRNKEIAESAVALAKALVDAAYPAYVCSSPALTLAGLEQHAASIGRVPEAKPFAFAVGDRVEIIEGRDSGIKGKIVKIDEGSRYITVKSDEGAFYYVSFSTDLRLLK